MENARLIETEGHPLVYADWLHAAGKPTVLFYGHYDVQPTDPLDEWLSPPFEPTERDGNLYARGAVDDKGQVWAQVKALESLLAATRQAAAECARASRRRRGGGRGGNCGLCRFEAAGVEGRLCAGVGYGVVCARTAYAVRGPARHDLHRAGGARGAKTDLHSGMYGGAAPNPFMALAQMLARLKDEHGHILIPGLLRRHDSAQPGGAGGVAQPAIRRGAVPDQPRWGRASWWARPATACWSGPGRGRRWTCTACRAALPARARRR